MSLLEEEDEFPVLQVFIVPANQSADSSLVALKGPSGNFIRFELIPERVVMSCPYIFTRKLPVILTSSMLRQPSLLLYPMMSEIWCQLHSGKKSAVLGESPLLGHFATKSGLKIHPEKVRAILKMLRSTDVKS